MKLEPNQTRTFWWVFASLFILSSLIPVLPFYMGPAGDVLLWVIPVWAMYVSLFVMPEWFLFSIPIVFTHVSVSYLVAHRLAKLRQDPIRFSLLSMLSGTSFVAVGMSLIFAHAVFGFCILFLACLITVTVGNYLGWKSIAGLPVPKMNQPILVTSAIICGVMIVLGMPVALTRIAG